MCSNYFKAPPKPPGYYAVPAAAAAAANPASASAPVTDNSADTRRGGIFANIFAGMLSGKARTGSANLLGLVGE